MSYADENKELAGKIKSMLNEFGIEVFLAHEDLPGGKGWEDEIIKNIKKCDIFVAPLTKDFLQSAYANQEIGIAIAHFKKIIPLQVDAVPQGFIKRFQSTRKLNQSRIEMFPIEFIKALNVDNKLKGKMIDCLVGSFVKSSNFSDAKVRGMLLETCDGFSKERVNKIVKAAPENDQVYKCFVVRERLLAFLESYQRLISPDILEQLKKEYESGP